MVRLARALWVLAILTIALVLGTGYVLAATTVEWTGNGTSIVDGVRVLDTVECDENNTAELHWVLTAAGADSATITVEDDTHPMEQQGQGGGAFHFYSTAYDLDQLEASATYEGEVNGNVVLTISHGCLPEETPSESPSPSPTPTPTPSQSVAAQTPAPSQSVAATAPSQTVAGAIPNTAMETPTGNGFWISLLIAALVGATVFYGWMRLGSPRKR